MSSKKRILFYYGVMAVVISISIFTVFTIAHMSRQTIGMAADIMTLENSLFLKTLKIEAEERLSDAKDDLFYVSKLPDLQDLINEKYIISKKELLKEVEKELLVFSESYKKYLQVRFINEEGKEIVRVNREDDISRVVEKVKLQDKSDRYYFEEASKLPEGSIYVSPLDLNIEEGIEELPRRPVIRLANPVFDDHHQRKGMVVLTLDASGFLLFLERNNTWLLNENKIFFASPRSEMIYKKIDFSLDVPHREIVSDIYFGKAEKPFLYCEMDFEGRKWLIGCHLDVGAMKPIILKHEIETYKIFSGFVIIFIIIVLLMFIWYRKIRTADVVERELRLAEVGRLTSGVMHDISTPIATICATPRLILNSLEKYFEKRDTLTEEERTAFRKDFNKNLNIITRACGKQERLIQEIRDIVTGEIPLNLETVKLKDFLKEIIPDFDRYVKNIDIDMVGNEEVTVDKGRIERVFLNLTKNAAEATNNKANIIISSIIDNKFITISFTDDGPGIPKARMKKLFTLGHTFGKKGGSGLGLFISRRILISHGGNIFVNSQKNKGATFIIKLPR